MKSQLPLIDYSVKRSSRNNHPRSKYPINDLLVNVSEKSTNHSQQQVLFLQTGLKNEDNYIKSLLL